MQVLIIEVATEKLAAQYSISLRGSNYNPAEHEYFDAAWNCAIEDKIVEHNSQAKYRFCLKN